MAHWEQLSWLAKILDITQLSRHFIHQSERSINKGHFTSVLMTYMDSKSRIFSDLYSEEYSMLKNFEDRYSAVFESEPKDTNKY